MVLAGIGAMSGPGLSMKARGATGIEEEFQQVLDYLTTNFKGEAAEALNLNTAASIDLESVLGLRRRFQEDRGDEGSDCLARRC